MDQTTTNLDAEGFQHEVSEADWRGIRLRGSLGFKTRKGRYIALKKPFFSKNM